MKVGLLIDDHMGRPGGVQEYVRGLGRYLQQQGHEAVVFSSGGPVGDVVRLVALGSPLNLKGSGSSTSIPVTVAAPYRLKRLLASEKCDILHVMAPYSPTLSGRLLTHSDAAHVMTFLVAIEPGPYRTALGALARLQRPSLRRIHSRIAISPTAAATAQALYGGSYSIIPCGVDTNQFIPNASPMIEGSDDTINLLYVGRLEQRKGVAYLIQAFARIEQQYPRVQLLIGGDGPERNALERLVAQLGLTRVRFLGYVPAPDLPRLLAAADIFCAPATYAESFGIVLVEAFAAGLPVIAASNPGYAGLLADHPGNLLVPPADDRVLAGALAVMVEQPVFRRQVGLRNRSSASRYSWQTVGSAILDVYERLLR
jgi:phosphatidylinositol alpha-mannosyltransferase